MPLAKHLSSHLRAAFDGGSFSETNFADLLGDLTLTEALAKPIGRNSAAALTYHTHFYVLGVLNVLRGLALDTSDGASWQTPDFESEASWRAFVEELLNTGRACADALSKLSDEQVWSYFADPKYSSVFTNVYGITEHLYYHLGQLSLIKRALRAKS